MGLYIHKKPLRLIKDGEVEGSGIFISNTYSLHCHHRNDSALRWAAVGGGEAVVERAKRSRASDGWSCAGWGPLR